MLTRPEDRLNDFRRHADSAGTVWKDRLAFSLWVPAAVAAALCAAVGRVLDADELPRWVALSATGSFVVYGVDRLRDLERDRATSPRRTAFIERNVTVFRVALTSACLGLALAAFGASPVALALCAGLGGLGLLHRRLKRRPALKSLYVSVAWTGVCVGLPWLASSRATTADAAWLVAILFPTFWSNLVASNLRDDEAAVGAAPALHLARAALALSLLASALGPDRIGPLGMVPAAQLLALVRFRPTEHYGHLVVDGALLAGALATLALA